MTGDPPDVPAAFTLSRAEPFADWPKDEVAAAPERDTLIGFLNYLRAVFGRKAEGLTEAQARVAACPPSTLTMLGLVRHMADVERGWSHRHLLGRVEPYLWGDDDWDPPAEATLAESLDAYWREIAAADSVYSAADLDDIERGRQQMYSLRWILTHLIEEYARHCGHADMLREALDGTTGD